MTSDEQRVHDDKVMALSVEIVTLTVRLSQIASSQIDMDNEMHEHQASRAAAVNKYRALTEEDKPF